jgi:hypothetical protein
MATNKHNQCLLPAARSPDNGHHAYLRELNSFQQRLCFHPPSQRPHARKEEQEPGTETSPSNIIRPYINALSYPSRRASFIYTHICRYVKIKFRPVGWLVPDTGCFHPTLRRSAEMQATPIFFDSKQQSSRYITYTSNLQLFHTQ